MPEAWRSATKSLSTRVRSEADPAFGFTNWRVVHSEKPVSGLAFAHRSIGRLLAPEPAG